MNIGLPKTVGWYAVYVRPATGAPFRRVAFCFPGRQEMLCEIRESEPRLVGLSDPYLCGATFSGPFATRAEALAAARTLGG